MTKDKLLFIFALCLISTVSFAQQNKDWGIGLRLGDPLGLSVKKYLAPRKAIEFNIGRTWRYNYSNAFYRHRDYNRDYYDYEWHSNRSSVSLQARYLVHKPLRLREVPGLEWYYGVGAQFRFFSVDYRYRYDGPGPSGPGPKGRYTDRVTHTDFGLDGVIGLEYSWRNVPITVFTDLNLFLEILDDPFLPHLQGGVGGRYYF